MRLDHIAYRVRDRKEAAQFLEDSLGYKIDPALHEGFDVQFEDGTMAKCFVLLPPESESTSGSYFINGYLGSEWHAPPEIFVSDGTQSSIVAEWVKANGPGIHHLAYQVSCVKKTMEEWRLKGIQFLSEEPMYCDGLVQVFTVPHPVTGLIYELIERESVGFCRDNVKKLMKSTEEK
jgi:catechol 2,3-dioxygenase-like lactoylglutathione lyase family enzyme